MSDFIRRAIPAAELLQVKRERRPQTDSRYTPYQFQNVIHRSRYFSYDQVIQALVLVLGHDVTQVFLKEKAQRVLSIAVAVLDDHMADNEPPPKDLQANLIVNFVVACVRAAQPLPAERFHYGENLIRACNFEPAFKLTLKEALFDRNAISFGGLSISRYTGVDPQNPGVW